MPKRRKKQSAAPATRTGAVRLKDAVRAKEAARTSQELALTASDEDPTPLVTTVEELTGAAPGGGPGDRPAAAGSTRMRADGSAAASGASGMPGERPSAAGSTRVGPGRAPESSGAGQDEDAGGGKAPSGDAQARPRAYTPPKGRPTPTRREAQARQRQPIVPVDRDAARAAGKEAQKARRARERAERARAREGMLAGEERYLAERDRGPVKRYLRDLVDSSWNIGDFLLPALFAFIALSIGLAYVDSPAAQYIPLALMWALIIGSLLQSYLLARRAKRRIPERFGTEPPRGVISYVMTRAFQMRISRSPRPMVERGAKVD